MFYIFIGILSTGLGIYWWKSYNKRQSKFDLINAFLALLAGGLFTMVGILELFQ